MSREDFARVVRRITVDPEFAKSLKTQPEKSLGGLSLTSSELRVVKDLDPDALATIVDSLDQRVTLPSVMSTNGCSTGTNGCTGGGGGGGGGNGSVVV